MSGQSLSARRTKITTYTYIYMGTSRRANNWLYLLLKFHFFSLILVAISIYRCNEYTWNRTSEFSLSFILSTSQVRWDFNSIFSLCMKYTHHRILVSLQRPTKNQFNVCLYKNNFDIQCGIIVNVKSLVEISMLFGSFVTENNKHIRENYPIAKVNKHILSICTTLPLEIAAYWFGLVGRIVEAKWTQSQCMYIHMYVCICARCALTHELVQWQCNVRAKRKARVYLPKKVFSFRQVRSINKNKCILYTYVGFGFGFSFLIIYSFW